MRKGWFISRGGKKMGNTIENGLATILTFLPIQAIRTLGSMLSNIKAFGHNFATNGFVGGLGKYGEEVAKNFKNTAINRAGRLLARGVVANVAGR